MAWCSSIRLSALPQPRAIYTKDESVSMQPTLSLTCKYVSHTLQLMRAWERLGILQGSRSLQIQKRFIITIVKGYPVTLSGLVNSNFFFLSSAGDEYDRRVLVLSNAHRNKQNMEHAHLNGLGILAL
jgi:hypothetical protein